MTTKGNRVHAGGEGGRRGRVWPSAPADQWHERHTTAGRTLELAACRPWSSALLGVRSLVRGKDPGRRRSTGELPGELRPAAEQRRVGTRLLSPPPTAIQFFGLPSRTPLAS